MPDQRQSSDPVQPQLLLSVTWKDGSTPVSTRFDDPYYSIQNGLEETKHVFLKGNGLPARFQPGFHVSELGFGTGLNMLAVWQMWLESGQTTNLKFTSFEAFPLQPQEIERALKAFPSISTIANDFLREWEKGKTSISLDGIDVDIIIGDARETLPEWKGTANAWFLDGFSPAKNPELWDANLLKSVAEHTRPGGTFATYTAAGHIRRTLCNVGFETDRAPGFGRKRHMTIGRLRH